MNIQKLLYQNILWRGFFYLSAFILNIFIARHFEAALTGRIYYLITIYAFITLITSLSLETGIVYFSSKNQISQSKLMNFSLLWVGLITVLMLVIFGIISLFATINSLIFAYGMLFVSGNILLTFITGLFYARKKYMAPNIVGIFINVLLIALLFFAHSNNSWLSNDNFLIIYFSSFLVQAILSLAILRSGLPKTLKISLPDKWQLKMLFHYCLLAFVANLFSLFLYRIDYWFVHRYCTAQALGNYIQVSKLAQMFFILPGILASAVFPLTAGDHRQKINNSLMMLCRVLLFFYGIACVILAIAGSWLFPVIFGESFTGMYEPFILLIPGILALSTLYTLTAYFAGKNQIFVNLKGVAIALVIIILGDAYLIPRYGINAAAAVSSLGYIAYHIYVLAIFTKQYKVSAIDFFYLRISDLQKIKNFFFKFPPA